MKLKLLVCFIVVIIVLLMTYDRASPYFAVTALKVAIASGDKAAIEEKVDFAHLQQSLKDEWKGQFAEALASKDEVGESDEEQSSAEVLGEGLGKMMAFAIMPKIIDSVVDVCVTPRGLSRLAVGESPFEDDGRPISLDEMFNDYRLTRDAFNRFSVWVPRKGPHSDELQFVFRREFASWRLSSIFIPREMGTGEALENDSPNGSIRTETVE